MLEKIRCPERDLNPRHPDLMTGALTTELPRQRQWSESNVGYKGNIDYQTFAPRLLGLGITSVGRRDMLIGPDVTDHTNVYHGIFRTNCSSSERSTLSEPTNIFCFFSPDKLSIDSVYSCANFLGFFFCWQTR